MLRIEHERGESIEETLRKLYVDENKTLKNITKELSISEVTAFRWLKLAGIYSHQIDI